MHIKAAQNDIEEKKLCLLIIDYGTNYILYINYIDNKNLQ